VDTAVSGSKLVLFRISPKGECRCHLGFCSETLLELKHASLSRIESQYWKSDSQSPLEPENVNFLLLLLLEYSWIF